MFFCSNLEKGQIRKRNEFVWELEKSSYFTFSKEPFKLIRRCFGFWKAPNIECISQYYRIQLGPENYKSILYFCFHKMYSHSVLELLRYKLNKEMYFQSCIHVLPFLVVIVWWNERRFRKSRKAFYWVFLQRRKSFSIPKPICF